MVWAGCCASITSVCRSHHPSCFWGNYHFWGNSVSGLLSPPLRPSREHRVGPICKASVLGSNEVLVEVAFYLGFSLQYQRKIIPKNGKGRKKCRLEDLLPAYAFCLIPQDALKSWTLPGCGHIWILFLSFFTSFTA